MTTCNSTLTSVSYPYFMFLITYLKKKQTTNSIKNLISI